MGEIIFNDLDLAEIHMGVAEQALIKASVDEGESQIKALLVARNSIDTALANLGFNNKDEIKRGLSRNKTTLMKNNISKN